MLIEIKISPGGGGYEYATRIDGVVVDRDDGFVAPYEARDAATHEISERLKTASARAAMERLLLNLAEQVAERRPRLGISAEAPKLPPARGGKQ